MSLSDKIKDVAYVNGFKQFLRRGTNRIFVASIIKISTFNKDVLDSEVTLCDCRKERSYQAAVSSWMVNMETSVGYAGGLAEVLSQHTYLYSSPTLNAALYIKACRHCVDNVSRHGAAAIFSFNQ